MAHCPQVAQIILTEQEKLEFYQSEFQCAPLSAHLTFRCTEPLQRFLDTKAMIEGRDRSQIIRRLLTKAAEEEGFSRDA